MRGSIRQRNAGTWQVRYTTGYTADGKRDERAFTVRGTKREAEAALRKALTDLDQGICFEPEKLTLGEYLERWLSDAAKQRCSAKTLEAYRNHIRCQVVPALGRVPLAKLAPLHLSGFYSKLLEGGRKDGRPGGLSAQTVLHYHRILHRALEQAVKWQLVPRNVCDAVEPPRARRKEMGTLDETQTARLLAAAEGTRLHLPILLAICTGMRRGEILALRWQDVDLAARSLAVRQSLEQTTGHLGFKAPKSGRSRVIALPSLMVEALVRHKAAQAQERLLLGPAYVSQDLVIARPDGRPYRPDVFSTEFGALVRGAGVPKVRLHDLRHGHATHLLNAGIHPKVVSERLGHSTIGITLDLYSHVVPGLQEEAAAKLDAALRKAMGG